MEFNKVGGQGLIQRAEFYTNLGTAGISGNADRLAIFTSSMNSRLGLILTMILRSQDSWDYDDINHTDFPILTTSLVSGQQDYSLPASENILKLKRVEVLLDGVWKRAEKMDVNQDLESVNTTTNYLTSSPKYDIQYNSVFLYPTPTSAVTGGLKLWITREPDYFTITDITQEAGIDEMFQEMIAVGASLDWALVKGLNNKNDLAAIWADYENRLKVYYGDKETGNIGLSVYQDNYK